MSRTSGRIKESEVKCSLRPARTCRCSYVDQIRGTHIFLSGGVTWTHRAPRAWHVCTLPSDEHQCHIGLRTSICHDFICVYFDFILAKRVAYT